MMVVLISSTLPDEPELDPKIAILLSLFAFFSFLFSFFFPGNGVDSMRCMGDDVKIRVEAEEGSVAQSPRTSHSQVVDTWTWSQHPRPSSSLKSPDTSCSVVVVWSLLSLVVLLDLIWESTVSCLFLFFCPWWHTELRSPPPALQGTYVLLALSIAVLKFALASQLLCVLLFELLLAMLLPRLSSLLGLVGLATIPMASAYDDNANIKSIPVHLHLLPVIY